MHALVATPTQTAITAVERPTHTAGHAVVRVELAGVCATDVAVSRGTHPAPLPRVLGHEFVGRVLHSERMATGTRVVVMPVFADGTMLGVEHDGAFTSEVRVPESALYAVHEQLPPEVAAFAEPVAACLAPAEVLPPRQEVWVLGEGRIATLTARSLTAAGHDVVGTGAEPPELVDAIIETTGLIRDLDPLVQQLRRRGSLVLKSRRRGRVSWSQERALTKEIRVCSAAYAHFDTALGMLLDGSVSVDGLVGPTFDLDQWKRAFAHAPHTKPFLRPCADS